MDLPQVGVGATEEHAQLILDSYKRWTKKDLIVLDPNKSLKEQLFYSSKFILTHGTEDDPILTYGNLVALKLWEMDWDTFTKTPSRLTAEPILQAEREKFFEQVSANGYVDQYTGIRISKSGKRFYIVDATVWNLVTDKGEYKGQAASFSSTKFL